jgi:hypothetical protein
MQRLADMGAASQMQAILCALPLVGLPIVISLMFRGEASSYYPILTRSIAELENDTIEARRSLYKRARETLIEKIGDELVLHRELIGLENAIKKIEATVPLPNLITLNQKSSTVARPTT